MNADQLPDNWLLTNLGAAVDYGKTFKAEPGEIPAQTWVLELEDIEKDTSRIVARLTQDERQSKSTKNRFDTGDVLYGKLRPYLNKVVIADAPGCCTTEIIPLKAGAQLDNRYLFYWLRHPDFLAYVEAESHGLNMPRLGTEMGKAAPFVLAPRNEQTRIADKLDAVLARVDACRDRLDRIPTILKRFRQSVLAAATSGKLTEGWRQECGARVTPDEVIAERRLRAKKDNERRALESFLTDYASVSADGHGLPTIWVVTNVGSIGVVSNGSTPSRQVETYWGGDIPWVSSGEVRNTVISSTRERISTDGYENSSVRMLPKGTVLIAMIGEGKTRGQSALLNIEGCINQNIAAVIPVESLMKSKYLWYWFQGQYENNRVFGNGTGPQALNCQRVRELPVNLPPLQEQTEIVRRIESLFAFADRLEARHAAARAQVENLTPATLAKAFRGELVPQDPNDEPASALLKRIRAQRDDPAANNSRRGRQGPQAKKFEAIPC